MSPMYKLWEKWPSCYMSLMLSWEGARLHPWPILLHLKQLVSLSWCPTPWVPALSWEGNILLNFQYLFSQVEIGGLGSQAGAVQDGTWVSNGLRSVAPSDVRDGLGIHWSREHNGAKDSHTGLPGCVHILAKTNLRIKEWLYCSLLLSDGVVIRQIALCLSMTSVDGGEPRKVDLAHCR